MNAYKNLTTFTLWVNRLVMLIMAVLLFAMPAILRWYTGVRYLSPQQQQIVMIAFYCCAGVIGWALWNMDCLLRNILADQIFIRKNVRAIRNVQRCCGIVSLICIGGAVGYIPLIFLVIIMAFLCLVVSVVARVMDAAVTLREENDLTI